MLGHTRFCKQNTPWRNFSFFRALRPCDQDSPISVWKPSLRSMAVLSSRAQERRSREIRARSARERAAKPLEKLLPPQSPRGFSALARLYCLARPTKTAMLRRLMETSLPHSSVRVPMNGEQQREIQLPIHSFIGKENTPFWGKKHFRIPDHSCGWSKLKKKPEFSKDKQEFNRRRAMHVKTGSGVKTRCKF